MKEMNMEMTETVTKITDFKEDKMAFKVNSFEFVGKSLKFTKLTKI